VNETETHDDGRIVRAARKREQRRGELLSAALRVFTERGYHNTRVSDLIEAAGVARGTFYLYFDSKQAIFHELLDELLLEIRGNMVGVDMSPTAPPVRDQILRNVRNTFEAFQAEPELAMLVLREAVGLDEEADRKLREFYDQLHSWIVASLENGKSLGLVRELDSDNVAWMMIGGVKQILQLVIEKRSPLDLDRMTEVVLDYNLQGVLAAR
jgi:AcrR family transcriptional regulator